MEQIPPHPADDGSDLIGRMIGGLRVDGILGAGGMGVVYRAFDTALHRDVAMKIASPVLQSAELFARFEREARALSAVSHPNVAQIHSIGRYKGRPYYVMELISGHSLQSVIDDGGHLSGIRCLRYLIEAAEGLRAAHDKGIVHRDIKPSNLMIGSDDRLRIVDFGLARNLTGDVSLTSTAMAIGTPRYMSPEQARAEKADHRSDIYSLGATFYHLFAGEPPFDSDSPLGLLMQHISTPLPPLKEKNPRVPLSVCAVIEKMMAKDPAERHQSWEEVLGDLRSVESGAGVPYAPSPATVGPFRPQPWMGIVAVAGLLLIVALIAGLRDDSRQAAPAAQNEAASARPVDSARPGESSRTTTTTTATAAPDLAPDEPEPATSPAPRTVRFDPAGLLGAAFAAKTMANLKKISMSLEVWKAERGDLPPDLETLSRRYELHPQELIDGWKSPIRYERESPTKYRLISLGADGSPGTEDDIVMENGYVVKGEPEFPIARP